MAQYTKKWLSVEEQLAKLELNGVLIGDREAGIQLLRAVGYYRLTGYLYPFRDSRFVYEADGRERVQVLNTYRRGTSLEHARKLIDFDRALRILVLDGIERIEISLRMQLGYVLGRKSPFVHLDATQFVSSFTTSEAEAGGVIWPSKHEVLITRTRERQSSSDESFVAHFRQKYDDQMPIWALTEIMEFGHLSRMYGGLQNSTGTEIAMTYGVPSKRIMASWIASLNYVRNVSAHHARLFNRKLVFAPKRPALGQIPLLDHLKEEESSKQVFGLYNVIAIMAYLLRSIDPECDWSEKMIELINGFPSSSSLTVDSLGMPANWSDLAIWAK